MIPENIPPKGRARLRQFFSTLILAADTAKDSGRKLNVAEFMKAWREGAFDDERQWRRLICGGQDA